MTESVGMPSKHPWEGPEHESFVPAVTPAQVKAMWENLKWSSQQHAGGGPGLHAIAQQGGLEEKAASYRAAMIGVLVQIFEEAPTKAPSNTKLQEQAKRFSKYRDSDALFTVMARIKLRWLGRSGNDFPLDVEDLLTQVEQAN
jgi:hypothetical protein